MPLLREGVERLKKTDKKFDKKQRIVFEMEPIAYEPMGERLIRVTCYLLGLGINRNGSSFTKEAVVKANAKLPHLPVVGHLIQGPDGMHYLGGHDIKIEDRGNEWEVVPLTVPLGCVAGDKEFEFVEIMEKDTGTMREYLKVDMILWNHMSPLFEAAHTEQVYFNNSIEIEVIDGAWDDTNNFRIDEFEYTATCLLGLDGDKGSPKHVEPCFPESKVYPAFAKGKDFNVQFASLMNEIRKFSAEEAQVETDAADEAEVLEAEATSAVTNDDGIVNNEKKEVVAMDVIFSEVCAKIREEFAKHVFRYRTGTQFDKYKLLSINEADKTITAIDRESGYSACKIPFHATCTQEEGLIVNIDFDSKVNGAIGVIEEGEGAFNVAAEILMITTDVIEYEVATHNSTELATAHRQIEALSAEHEQAKARIADLEKQLNSFQREKSAYEAQKKKDVIDALIASRRDEMGKFSEFLEYLIDMNSVYAKDPVTVENDLKEIHYNFMLKYGSGVKRNFSAIEVPVVGADGKKNLIAERYGADIAKYFE